VIEVRTIRLATLVAALAASALSTSFSRTARAEYRAAFPYRDAEFLSPGEVSGGMVVVPDTVDKLDKRDKRDEDAKVPLVVLLHGVNLDQVLHMWFGTRGYPDVAAMSATAIASGSSPAYILAGPSQTKGATSGRRMWQDFDLDDFIRAVEAAVGAHAVIDHDAVFVVGHSGAGCNPDGGLLRVARAPSLVVPRGIFAIDTCMDEDSGAALGSSPESAKVWVRYQSEIWPRPLDRFRATFRTATDVSGHAEPFVQVVNGLAEPVHISILLDTFTTFLPAVLAGREIPVPASPAAQH
jgi:hypothetical protein